MRETRKHIWTFAASSYYSDTENVLILTITGVIPLPSFTGNNYFCESGFSGPGFHQGQFYPDAH